MAHDPSMSDPYTSTAIVRASEAAPANPALLVHRALRGRYRIAVASALAAGLIGSAIGWFATKPLYSSLGWIRAFPRQPRVLYETEDNQMMPMFEAFVRSQADLMRSRRVIDLALSEPSLKETAWPAPPVGVQKLIEALEVTAQRGSELISVSVSHENPLSAQVAANAVLTAFMKYQEEQDGMTATERERRLRDNQQLLNSELKAIRESIIRTSDQFGGGDPDILLMAKTEQLTRLDSQSADLALSQRVMGEPQTRSEPVQPPELSTEDLARSDLSLGSLLTQRQAVSIEIETKSKRLGPNHTEMKSLRERFEGIESLITARVDELRQGMIGQQSLLGDPSVGADPALAYRNYQSLRERIATEIRELSRARMEVRTLRDREEETQKRLAETSKALDIIRVENEVIRGGRVRIQQRAATPLEPTKDRRLPLAVGGFLAGAGSVIGCFVLLSLAKRQLRFADELESAGHLLPLIGVIPEVGGGSPEEVKSITLALHHVRNSLLLFREREKSGGVVYLVTSAVPGEGKTTLGIALGTSFAQAGYRTTIVDCDLIGRGMTRELSLAKSPGFCDALGHPASELRLHATHVKGLEVLPAGPNPDDRAPQLTLEEVAPIVEELRQRSDIVVIDTGPVLGSLEAGLLAQLSDTVVIIAARGTNSRVVTAALDRVRSLCNAGVALVFNRADYHDLTTSASYSSMHSRADDGVSEKTSSTTDRGRLVRILAPKQDGHQDNGVIM